MNSPQGFNTLGISLLWVGISLPGLKETFQRRPWWEILRCLELGKSGDFDVTALLTQFDGGMAVQIFGKTLANIGQYSAIFGNIGQIFGNIGQILGKSGNFAVTSLLTQFESGWRCKYWATYLQILCKILANIGQIFGKYWANFWPILGNIGQILRNIGQHFGQYWAKAATLLWQHFWLKLKLLHVCVSGPLNTWF